MSDRLDTVRKRLASGNPFTPHASDLAWAIGEIERLAHPIRQINSGTRNVIDRIEVLASAAMLDEGPGVALTKAQLDFACAMSPRVAIGIVAEIRRLIIENASLRSQLDDGGQSAHQGDEGDAAVTYARAEIARLDALSRATTDDPEGDVPCLACGRVDCACAEAADEMEDRA